MSSIIKNAAVLALISGSTQAYRINQRASVGVRFIETPKDDSNLMMFDDDFEQETKRQSLEQVRSDMSESQKSDKSAGIDSNQAYSNFINEKYNKVPEVPVQTKAPQTVLATPVIAPKPTVGNFRKDEPMNQAQLNEQAGQLMLKTAIKVYGGGKGNYYNSDPEVQLAIAQANTNEDSAMVDKQLSKIDTDRENDEAIKNSISFIRTDQEKTTQVFSDAKKFSDLEYMSKHGNDKQRKQAEAEMNKVNTLGPQPAAQTITREGDAHPKVPEQPIVKGEFVSKSVSNILKDAGSAYPLDNIVEIEE